MITEATVKTKFGSVYLKKLCRHFARKVPTTVDKTKARIEFPFGTSRINVDDDQLHLQIEVKDSSEINCAEQIVADHLIRMAHKENLTVQWVRNDSSAKETTT